MKLGSDPNPIHLTLVPGENLTLIHPRFSQSPLPSELVKLSQIFILDHRRPHPW